MSMLQLDQLVVPVVLAAFVAALSALLPSTTMPGGPVVSPGARSPAAERTSAAPSGDGRPPTSASAEVVPAAPARARGTVVQPAGAVLERPGPVAPVAGSGLVPPLRPPVPGALSRGFEAPASPYGSGHRGVDLEAPVGAEVTAPAPGRVRFAGQVGGAGWVSIEIVPSVTVSLGPLTGIAVRAGDDVGVRTILGQVAPGHGEGLHLGLRVGGAYADPQPYLARFGAPRLVPLAAPARPDGRRQPAPAGVVRTASPAPQAAQGKQRPRPRSGPRSATQRVPRAGAASQRPAAPARRARPRGKVG